jgi:hypothetical protein
VREWSAGAGIDAVLETDAQMLNYIFPGYATEGVAAITPTSLLNPLNPNSSGTQRVFNYLNMRELPQAIAFMDWNHWLTPMSLRDFSGSDAAYDNSFIVSTFNNAYAATMAAYTKNPTDYTSSSSYLNVYRNAVGKLNNGPNNNETGMFPLPAASPTALQTFTWRYDIHLWLMVKTWQMQDTFQLSDKTHYVFDNNVTSPTGFMAKLGANPDAVDLVEPRGWLTFGDAFLVPNVGVRPPNFISGTLAGENYLHESWYYLQLVLNPGMGQAAGNANIDWGYFQGTLLGSDGGTLYADADSSSSLTAATLDVPCSGFMPCSNRNSRISFKSCLKPPHTT